VTKLTKRICDAAKPRERQFVVWCSELPRFGLRVRETGARVFIVQFRANGRSRVVTIGPYGALTVDQARREARKLLGDVERGSDPAARRDGQREALSVRELAEKWLEQHVTPKLKARSVAEDRRLLDRLLLPALGKRNAADVTRADLSRLHASLAGTPIQANRVLSLASALFNFGERIGVRPEGANPVRGIARYRERRRERYLSAAELTRLGIVLAECERDGAESPEVVGALRLLLFTGARVSEILGARWRDVDTERGVLRLEDAKAGSREVLISAPAFAALDALPRSGPFLIPGREKGRPLVNLGKAWRRIRARADLADVRIHDLRHTTGSFGVSAGLSLYVVGALLGHRQASTSQRYGHLQSDPLRQASDTLGARIAAALDGKPDADVIALPRAKGDV
jgi:integrase